MKPFERPEVCHARVDQFSHAHVRETVIVCFTRPDRDDKFEVCLDREAGEFLGASYLPEDGALIVHDK